MRQKDSGKRNGAHDPMGRAVPIYLLTFCPMSHPTGLGTPGQGTTAAL